MSKKTRKPVKLPIPKPRNPNWKNRGTIKHPNKKREQKGKHHD